MTQVLIAIALLCGNVKDNAYYRNKCQLKVMECSNLEEAKIAKCFKEYND